MFRAMEAGDRGVVAQIEARTDADLTLLSLTVRFDPSLCDEIEHVVVERAGRALVEIQEGAIECPRKGRIRIVLFDLVGEVVLPSGEGVIARVTFDVRHDATSRRFPLDISVDQVSNGPVALSLDSTNGILTIGEVPPCVGHCDGDGRVSIHELVQSVHVAMGGVPVGDCPDADRDDSGRVSIDEITAAVRNGLKGCEPR